MLRAMNLPGCWRHPPALLAAGLLVLAGGPAWAQLPTVTTRTETWTGSGPPPDRDAIERAQWEQWQLQREQWRQQRDLTRQDDQRQRQSEESLGQRALREQAQNRREQGRVATPSGGQSSQPAMTAPGSGQPAQPQRPSRRDY